MALKKSFISVLFICLFIFVLFKVEVMLIMMIMNCFYGMVDRWKLGPLSEILTITNLRHAASRIWTCAEPDLSLRWMKLCTTPRHHRSKGSIILSTNVVILPNGTEFMEFFSTGPSDVIAIWSHNLDKSFASSIMDKLRTSNFDISWTPQTLES